MDDWGQLVAPGGLGALFLALFAWIRTHLKSGELTLTSRNVRELKKELERVTAEKDAAILRADRAEERADRAEEDADRFRDRFIDKLEELLNGSRHDPD